jgi:hypothetical protein
MGQDTYCALCGKASADETGSSAAAANASRFGAAANPMIALMGGCMGDDGDPMLGNMMQMMLSSQMREMAAAQNMAEAEGKMPEERQGEFGAWLGKVILWTPKGEVIPTTEAANDGWGRYRINDEMIDTCAGRDDESSLLCHARCFECLEETAADHGVALRSPDESEGRIAAVGAPYKFQLDFVTQVQAFVADQLPYWSEEKDDNIEPTDGGDTDPDPVEARNTCQANIVACRDTKTTPDIALG